MPQADQFLQFAKEAILSACEATRTRRVCLSWRGPGRKQHCKSERPLICRPVEGLKASGRFS